MVKCQLQTLTYQACLVIVKKKEQSKKTTIVFNWNHFEMRLLNLSAIDNNYGRQ